MLLWSIRHVSSYRLGVAEQAEEALSRFPTLVDTREVAARTFDDYHRTCVRIAEAFGRIRLVDDLRSEDFEQLRAQLAAKWGPVTLGNEVQRVRSIFRYAYEAGLIDKPVRFGPGFKRPSKKTLRKDRQSKGLKLFDAEQIHVMLPLASVPLRAMILLAINGGLGNVDCGMLPKSALDLDKGWLDYPRPKTGVPRRIPLWPETVAALREALAERPAPNDPAHDGLVFITRWGEPWVKTMKAPTAEDGTPANSLVLLAFGWSRQDWLGVPLPLPLASIGMPGCSLLVSLDGAETRATVGSTLQQDVFLPYVAAVLGFELSLQGFALDGPANPAGITVSNGIALRLGGL